MERLGSQIDLAGQYVYFTIVGKSLRVNLDPNCSLNNAAADEYEHKVLTTESSNPSSVDESDIDSEEVMVVVLAVEDKPLQPQDGLIKEEILQSVIDSSQSSILFSFGGTKKSRKDVS